MFETTIIPRFSETDAVGHINNSVFPAWFEAARMDFFRVFNPEMTTHNWTMLVVRYELDFMKEVNLTPEVLIRTQVTRVGNSSVQLLERLFQDGVLKVVSKVTYVSVDPRTRRATRITDQVRVALEPFMLVEDEDVKKEK